MKKLLTSLDIGAIIVNCIIIAYYAHFADKQVFVSINLLYISDFAKRHRSAELSESKAPKSVIYYFEWSDWINGQRKRAEAWSEHKNELFKIPFFPRSSQPRRSSDEILQVVL